MSEPSCPANRFKEFVKRHETKSYGTSIDQPVIDTRLDTPLSAAGRAVEGYYVPNALEPAEDEAVVLAVLPHRAGMMTSYDPKMQLVADIDKAQEKMFDLKCYVLTRPTTAYTDLNKLSVLEPQHVSLLPTFTVAALDGASTPEIGDVVIVRYDTLTHTKGDYIRSTGINISDMFSEAIACEALAKKFKSSAKKTPIPPPAAAATLEELRAQLAAKKAADPGPPPTKLQRWKQLYDECEREARVVAWAAAGGQGNFEDFQPWQLGSHGSTGFEHPATSQCATRAQIAEQNGYGGRNSSGALIQAGRPETWDPPRPLGSRQQVATRDDQGRPTSFGSSETWVEGKGWVPAGEGNR